MDKKVELRKHRPWSRGLAWSFLCVVWLALVGCASLPPVSHKEDSKAMVATDGRLAFAVRQLGREHGEQTGIRLLGDGLDAFAARVVLADAATVSIDVQYYLFHNDSSGRLLLDRLLAAADRGVRVRLLIDDMDTAGRDRVMLAIDAHPNVEVRLFNPFANRGRRYVEMVTRFGRVSRRMHNKSFTVDGLVTLVGGRNVGDEYFSAHPDVEFGDLDVLAVGPVSRDVAGQFDLYWNDELAYPVRALAGKMPGDGDLERARVVLAAHTRALRDSEYVDRIRGSRLVGELLEGQLALTWGDGRVFYDLPDKLVLPPEDRSTHMGPKLRALAEATQDDLLIFSPYFVPGEEGLALLGGLAERGVRVRVLTNSLASTDVAMVHSGYAKYRRRLLEAGVELHEAKPQPDRPKAERDGRFGSSSRASLHAKTFVFDRTHLFVGSFNLDPRSAVLNTEMGIDFKSPELAERLADWYEENRQALAYEVRLTPAPAGSLKWIEHSAEGERRWSHDPETGAFQRLLVRLLGWLPIEGQL